MVNALGRHAGKRTAYTVSTPRAATRTSNSAGFFARRLNLLGRLLGAGAVGVSLLGCSCNLLDLESTDPNLPDPGSDPTANQGNSGTGNGGSGGGSNGGTGHGGTTSLAGASFGGATLTADAAESSLRRLTNYEYDNTVRDLFGTTLQPGVSFPADATWGGFDNAVDGQRTTEALYEEYFAAALAVANDLFSDETLRARVLACAPSAQDMTCTRLIAETLGTRVWRRPLDEIEIQSSMGLFQDAIALGETPEGAVQHMVRGWLSSPQFLYRMELDPEPEATTPRPLNGYELASRLSYLLWSSTPDDGLLDAALQNQLDGTNPAQLQTAFGRLLADPKSAAFVEHYGGQWLKLNYLPNHPVDAATFPTWSETLRTAMQREGYNYFNEFLRNDLPLTEFFTHDVNFVDAELATHYGFAQPSNELTRVQETGDVRRGFLGLGAFLTSSSPAHRTSPTWRGRRVLEDLLCVSIPAPPPVAPILTPPEDPAIDTTNIRAALEQHLTNPSCAACHAVIDPFGLGLENFDGIGAYRTTYSNGDAIDASAVLPDGTQWSDFTGMTDVLAADPRLFECATQKLFQYAQGRSPRPTELPYLEGIHDQALAEGATLKALLQQLILSEPFRYRHASTEPFEIPPSYL